MQGGGGAHPKDPSNSLGTTNKIITAFHAKNLWQLDSDRHKTGLWKGSTQKVRGPLKYSTNRNCTKYTALIRWLTRAQSRSGWWGTNVQEPAATGRPPQHQTLARHGWLDNPSCLSAGQKGQRARSWQHVPKSSLASPLDINNSLSNKSFETPAALHAQLFYRAPSMFGGRSGRSSSLCLHVDELLYYTP